MVGPKPSRLTRVQWLALELALGMVHVWGGGLSHVLQRAGAQLALHTGLDMLAQAAQHSKRRGLLPV